MFLIRESILSYKAIAALPAAGLLSKNTGRYILWCSQRLTSQIRHSARIRGIYCDRQTNRHFPIMYGSARVVEVGSLSARAKMATKVFITTSVTLEMQIFVTHRSSQRTAVQKRNVTHLGP